MNKNFDMSSIDLQQNKQHFLKKTFRWVLKKFFENLVIIENKIKTTFN